MGADAREIGLVLFGGPWDLLSHFVSPVTANLWEGDMTPGAEKKELTAEAEGKAGWPMAEASIPKLREEAEATPCPSVQQLEELLRGGRASCSRVDEVWPNLFIGDA